MVKLGNMEAKLLHWLSSIEKLSKHGETELVVKGLCSVCAILKMMTNMPEGLKTEIITRLTGLVIHESSDVVGSVVPLLSVLTDDFSELPSELTLSIMQKMSSLLSQGEKGDHIALVSEVLSDLTLSNSQHVKLLISSGCLEKCLYIFSHTDFSESSLKNINCLVNVIMCAMSNRDNKKIKILIGKTVIPKVLGFLLTWLNDDPVPEMYMVLKDLLFLCRNITSGVKECQNVFIENMGLEALFSALQKTEIMIDHLDIVLPMRQNGFIDYSETIFSSIVILVDAVITHNNRACLKALELDAIWVLKQYLDIESTSKKQKIFIIETIVHLLEAEVKIPSPSLVNKMYDLVKKTGCSSDVLSYLQSKCTKQKPSKRAATPHPNKSLSRKKSHHASDHPNDSVLHQCADSSQEIQEVASATKTCLKKSYKSKCTPHPKKGLAFPEDNLDPCDSTKLAVAEQWSQLLSQESQEFASDDAAGVVTSYKTNRTPNSIDRVHIKKPLKRLSRSPSNIFALSRDQKNSPANFSQMVPAPEAKLIPCSPKPEKYVISQAELLVLMQCVQVHGVNMQSIRSKFPFHRGLTPADLYALWRALWGRKPSRRFI